jgi:hypothetical protein
MDIYYGGIVRDKPEGSPSDPWEENSARPDPNRFRRVSHHHGCDLCTGSTSESEHVPRHFTGPSSLRDHSGSLHL